VVCQDRHPCARTADIDCALGAGPGGHQVPDTHRRPACTAPTSPEAVGSGLMPSDQNPVPDNSRACEIKLNAEEARLLLDDPALDRIINAVGQDRPGGLDRDALRHDLLICYGRYSIASGLDPQNARLVQCNAPA